MKYFIQVLRKDARCYNESNQYEYVPIVIKANTKRLIVDKMWYSNTLTGKMASSIKTIFPDLLMSPIKTPHTQVGIIFDSFEKNDVEGAKIFWKFYYTYRKLFNMYNYRDQLESVIFIEINHLQKEDLIDFCRIGILTSHKPNLLLSDSLIPIYKTIEDILETEPYKRTGIFVKTSQKSSKNEFIMYPAFNVVGVLDNLVHSIEILKDLDCTTHLVIKPWININKGHEFRVFVENNQIVAISQQNTEYCCSKDLDWNMLISQLDIIVTNLPYNSVVLDTYFDDVERKMILIECNPGGRWCSSSSGLFTWAEITSLAASNSLCIRLIYD